MYSCFRYHADFVARPTCHPDFIELPAPRRSPRCWRSVRPSRALAQSDDGDPEMRIQQLEEPAAAAHRPERGIAAPEPAAAGAPEAAAGRRASGARRSARGRLSRTSRRCRRRSRRIADAEPGLSSAAAPAGLRPADRGSGADRAGAAAARPAAPRRCLRSQPESQCPGRAARARRRPVADANEAPVGAPGGRGAGEPLNIESNTSSATAARCRRRRRPAPAPA